MNSKFWIAGVLVAVIYFLLGGFFYAWLMKDWFSSQSTANMTDPNVAVIALMCLSYGLLMAYLYPIGYKGGSAVSEGIRFGILFALIINLPSGLGIIAMGSWNWPAFLVGLVWELVCGAGLGILTARIYAGSAKAVAPAR